MQNPYTLHLLPPTFKTMKIGFEAKRAFKNFTGLGNYARSVIQILAQQNPENQYFLYTPDSPKNPRTNFLFELKNVFIKTAPVKLLKSYWRSKGVVKDLVKDGVELYHGLSHEIPSGLKSKKIKSVVTIHDLIFMRYPHYYKYIDRKIYSYKFKTACLNADTIIAISEQTKRDIISYFGIAESKIKIVYQGCDEAFYKQINIEDLTIIKQKFNLKNDFLLCVGSIEKRKNQLLIVKALKHLPKNIDVVLVGKPTPYQQEITDFVKINNLENRVHILNHVGFSDLPGLYQAAKIFIYPSKFEGFGIPILEALNSGIPVIAAKGSCLEEAGGPQSIYISPTDDLTLAKEINKLLNTPLLYQEMVTEGKKYALNFREVEIANALMQVYKETLAKN